MTTLEFFKEIFGSIWDGMSSITVPLLNIPVTSFVLGAFIVGVSIGILQPLLGIGGGIVDSFGGLISSAKGRIRSRRSFNESKRYHDAMINKPQNHYHTHIYKGGN